jgi:hypothetical protein
MEALLEKEGKVENWNDDRLDELNQTMKEGFAKSDREMKEGFARLEQGMKEVFERVDKRFEQVDKRFEKLDERFFRFMIVMLVIGGGMISALITAQV